jgi:hypothetical protein
MGVIRKGLFTFSLVLIPVLILSALISIRIAEKEILESEAEKVSLITDIVRNGLVTIMIEGRGRDLKRFLDTLIAEEIEGIYILGRGGDVISSSASPILDRDFRNRIISQSWKGRSREMALMKINERDIYSSILPIYNERTCQKCHGSKEDIRAILHIEVSRKKTLSKINALRYQITGITVFVFVTLLYLFYRFNLKELLKPAIGMSEAIKGNNPDLEDMDEIHILILHIKNLSAELERKSHEIRALSSTNKEISGRIEEIKKRINEEITLPLIRITASIEAFSEEIDHKDPKREIIRAFINELNRLSKTLEGFF